MTWFYCLFVICSSSLIKKNVWQGKNLKQKLQGETNNTTTNTN